MNTKPFCGYLLLCLTACVVVSCVAPKRSETSVRSGDNEWAYWRVAEVYVNAIRVARIPEEERAFFRRHAYNFFFRYWILHRSQHAQFSPLERFEQSFAVMLKNDVLPFVDTSDPLGLSTHYKDGRLVRMPMFDLVEGLPNEQLKTWASYQQYVEAYKSFIDCKAEQWLKNNRIKGKEG